MIHVNPIPPDDPPWKTWITEAGEARARLIRTSLKSLKINEDLYKAPRLTLLKLFHNKCAYCESPITADQHLGDVEHYRPKGRVTDEEGKPVFVADGHGQQLAHPGYYWLAYDWLNLLPACIGCNRPGQSPSGMASGKWDKFPVAAFRAVKPGEEAQEEPVLLNPWRDDPNDHLIFDDERGVVVGKTDRGKMTIRILGLNREALIEERRRAYCSAKAHYVLLIDAIKQHNQNEIDDHKSELGMYESGSAPYSAAARAAVRKVDAAFIAELEKARNAVLGLAGPPH